MSDLPVEIRDILQTSVNEDLRKFKVTVNGNNKKDERFLGDVYFISLRNNETKEFNLVVKQAFGKGSLRTDLIRQSFVNEINFYTKVWPTLQEFQNKVTSKNLFAIPKCFAAVSDEYCERIVLDNLKFQNFQLYDKKKPFNKDHCELIMKEYGKLHALSFAYRAIYPEKFTELTKTLVNVYSSLVEDKKFQMSVKFIHKLCLESLQEGVDVAVIEKYKKYTDEGTELFRKSTAYEGKYSAILHGDSWGWNMMFGYDDCKKLVDMRLIDFQLSSECSPACDLSYCLYSGATKEVLDDLDYFLQVYHDSLSDTLSAFGCDGKTLFPMAELKKDWKRHCKLGITMGLMIWRRKLRYDPDDDTEDIAQIAAAGYDKKTFMRIARDLLVHAHQNDFL